MDCRERLFAEAGGEGVEKQEESLLSAGEALGRSGDIAKTSMIQDAGWCLTDRKSWLVFAVGIFVGVVLTNIQVASVSGGAGSARLASDLPVREMPF